MDLNALKTVELGFLSIGAWYSSPYIALRARWKMMSPSKVQSAGELAGSASSLAAEGGGVSGEAGGTDPRDEAGGTDRRGVERADMIVREMDINDLSRDDKIDDI